MITDAPEELFSDDDGVLYAEEVAPLHSVFGFTLRELLVVVVWLVMFVTSLFAVSGVPTLWSKGITWLLPLGIPTAAVFLIVLRRFSPEGIRRVGSLGIDQFASVAFSVAALWWVQTIWEYISVTIQTGVPLVTWVLWVQLATQLAFLALTVFAPFVPGLREDFRGRLVTLAHRNANPARPVQARPRPERPVPTEAAPVTEPVEPASEDAAAPGFAPEPFGDPADEPDDGDTHDAAEQLGLVESVPLSSHASGGATGTAPELDDDYTPAYARSSRGESASDEGSQYQPFWALAPTERTVFDERGETLFEIGPDAWALVIEDRGGAYVVRHDDGRIGYLHDISDITKG